jgi:exodeoxyribonuclease V alpha subunit
MPPDTRQTPTVISETLRGVVDRVTYHNPDNGWSVLKVSRFDQPGPPETVVVHQTQVFAGATMTFTGSWTVHPKYGRQFRASTAVERKPASAAALEKYLGSGLIKGVGPKTARKIVAHFNQETLSVFENRIERLVEVPGIAKKKLEMIRSAWAAHRAIREVMMFLQSHGISTLFAVRIYKEYGDDAIAIVSRDPYRLADDFYGIGFFSADRVALSIGFDREGPQRLMAGIKHALAASRDFGHCYLTRRQIRKQVSELLDLRLAGRLSGLLEKMTADGEILLREQPGPNGALARCYYSRSLYYDERYVARRLSGLRPMDTFDAGRARRWMDRYCSRVRIRLSDEQAAAVVGIAGQRFAILTGGPGCGKTTATRVLVKLLEAMGRRVLLAAPTGRAAQRMTDVIGRESKTIHRLLEWQVSRFRRNQDHPLKVDFLIVDECSMLDIGLTASLLKAVPADSQVLFIGDADQLPSVGAGNVLRDLIDSGRLACFRLTRVFRQARSSLIIRYAHQINRGDIPRINSPFNRPALWRQGADCLFIDTEEATQEQLTFIARIRQVFDLKNSTLADTEDQGLFMFRADEPLDPYASELTIPAKFRHVDLHAVAAAENRAQELMALIKKVHPWSTLHYGLSAVEVVRKLVLDWIPKYHGRGIEIQVLTPMTRGSLGTVSLNRMLQEAANPPADGKAQLQVGERVFRVGDRVIHRRNNYDLGVFNGDIGTIDHIDHAALTCRVIFLPDGREVTYQRDNIPEMDLAYAVTIHKSQGSEFPVVVIPVVTQHFKMLFRNLIYTGLTRARKLAVLVGTRRALAMSVSNIDTSRRQTALADLLRSGAESGSGGGLSGAGRRPSGAGGILTRA